MKYSVYIPVNIEVFVKCYGKVRAEELARQLIVTAIREYNENELNFNEIIVDDIGETLFIEELEDNE